MLSRRTLLKSILAAPLTSLLPSEAAPVLYGIKGPSVGMPECQMDWYCIHTGGTPYWLVRDENGKLVQPKA